MSLAVKFVTLPTVIAVALGTAPSHPDVADQRADGGPAFLAERGAASQMTHHQGSYIAPAHDEVRSIWSLLPDIPWMKQGECGKCVEGCDSGGGEWGHEAPGDDGYHFSEGDGWHGTCLPGSCWDLHDPCGTCAVCEEDGNSSLLSVDVLVKVWEGVRSGTMGIEEVLTEYPEEAEFNRERNALQVVACDGTIVAHLTLGTRATE